MLKALAIVFLALSAAAAPTVDQKSKECPEGYVLKGKTCEAILVHEPQYVCPRGTTSADGQCLTFAPLKAKCSPGFTQGNDVCSRVVTEPAQYYCNEGELQGTVCKLEIPQAPVCPSGYTMRHESCIRHTPILKRCPAGYSQRSKECSKRVSFPASPECPAGMDLSSSEKKCFKFEEKRPFCPAGFQMKDGQCVKAVGKIPVPCPAGYKASAGGCEAVEKYPAEPLCPDDMELDQSNEICVKEIPVPPTCPKGYVASDKLSGECERVLPSRAVCPPDTVAVGQGKCQRKIVTAKYPQCPEGYEMIGEKCKKVEEFPSKKVCRGGVQEGDQCSFNEASAPQYSCPVGYELTKTSKGPQCARAVNYDCSTTVMKKECEMPDFVDQLTPTRKLKSQYAPVRPSPAASTKHTKQPVCRQVAVQVPKTCAKQETVPVEFVCPENGVLVGKSCQTKQYLPAQDVCTAGDMDAATGRCLKISVTAPTWHCASGKDAGGNSCVELDTLPADYVCGEGLEVLHDYSRNQVRCVERKAQVFFPNKVVKHAPKFTCSVGSLNGRVCIQHLREPREYRCPDDATEAEGFGTEGKCYTSADVIVPAPQEITASPKYVCPNGSAASNRLCYTVETTEIEEYCMGNMELEDGKCVAVASVVDRPPIVKTNKATLICSDGLKLQGTTCRYVEQEPVVKYCPDNYDEYNHNGKQVCAIAHELQEVCPPGTTRSGEGCITRKHAPPQVTIVRTCTKGQPGCH